MLLRRRGCASGFWRSDGALDIKHEQGLPRMEQSSRMMHPCSLLNLDRLTPTQRLIVEQAYLMAQELEAAADTAPEGQVT